jgi:hypothetical protein
MGSGELSDTRSNGWNSGTSPGVQLHVNDALDTDLDAYLDRELFTQPASGLTPAPAAAQKPAERLQGVLALAAEEEQWLRTLPPPEEPQENSKDLESKECPIPEHLKVKPAPVAPAPVPVEPRRVEVAYISLQTSLPGLTAVPVPAQPWNPPVAPEAPRRGRWLVAGALAGVGTAGVLAASMLWMARDTLFQRPEAREAHVPAVAATAVQPSPVVPAPERTLFVENSPLQRQPEPLLVDWSGSGPVPGPVVPGRVEASQASQPAALAVAPEPKAEPVTQAVVTPEPKAEPVAQAVAAPEPKVEPVTEPVESRPQLSEVTGAMARASQRLGHLEPIASSSLPEHGSKPALTASVKAQAAKPRETAQAQRAPAEAKAEPRRLIEDPYLEDAEDETPFLQQPQQAAPAPAAVAKAEPVPAAPSKPSEFEDLDEDFAREMGFTPDSKPKVPESNAVKSVWIPPDPASHLPEGLTPEQIQQVVVANQPAIVDCIKRFKDTVPGVSGGKFVLRWFVHPDGSTYGQKVETRELSGTALGTCIERLVPTWKFPKHRVKQQTPIRFPFIF